jgi:hypothetical protein
MNKSRRRTLQLFGIGLSVVGTQSHARQFAQSTLTPPPTTPAPEGSAAPGSFVNGTYEATYQEGYAPAFLSVGFPESAVFAMHPAGSQQMTITVTEKVMWLRTRRGGLEQQIALNAPVSTDVFGVRVADWLARFDTPSRLLISFTAPNGPCHSCHTDISTGGLYHPPLYRRCPTVRANSCLGARLRSRGAQEAEGLSGPALNLL